MFEREARFTPVLTPQMIDAAHRKARRERSKVFHEFVSAIRAAFRGVPKEPDIGRFTVGERTSTRSC